jgi:hypothetical protein
MSAFSATEAAFEGFRVARERPWAIVAWAGVAFVFLAGDVILRSFLIDTSAIQASSQALVAGETPGQQLIRMVAATVPYFAAAVPISLVFYGILFAAAYRVVLEPKSSINGLRLGIQELRQVLVILISGLLIFVAYTGAGFLCALAYVLMLPFSKPLAAVIGALSVVVSYALLIVAPIRLSLAGPHTFVEHRLRPFASWRMSHGHFWPMLGAYVFATVFAVVVVLLGMAILAGLFAFAGDTVQHIGATPANFADNFRPLRIVYLIGSAFIIAQAWAIIACPAASIFRQLNREAVP